MAIAADSDLKITYPPELPVSARRDDLLAAIAAHQVVIVAGETGSGKTTQLPKMCLELGRGVRGAIAHTQPRRLAARTVAERIADELDVSLGNAVGYAVRFNDRSSEETLLRLMAQDKKVKGGHLALVLSRGIGQAFVERDVDMPLLTDFLTRECG